MLTLILTALFLLAPDAEISTHNAQAIAAARAAVGAMIRTARSREEQALAEKDRQLVEQAAELLARRDAGMRAASSRAGEKVARKQIEEAQASFNLQYLQLQAQMQHEHRSYTAISNVMRARHDTVKNSIANIR